MADFTNKNGNTESSFSLPRDRIVKSVHRRPVRLPSGVIFFLLSQEKCSQQILRIPLPTDQVTVLKNNKGHEDQNPRSEIFPVTGRKR